MSLLQQIFSPKRPSPKVDHETEALEEYDELEEYDVAMAKKQTEARQERDRTARIAEYLRCTAAGRDDCRMDISWEEMARQGMTDGAT